MAVHSPVSPPPTIATSAEIVEVSFGKRGAVAAVS
jgi:hypothetical protein